jgi:hypothetical protein
MNAQIALGNHEVDARNLSFAKCLELCGGKRTDGGYRDMQYSEEGYSHENWKDSGMTVAWEVEDRDRPHRPTVPNEIMESMEEVMETEWPTVPTESLSFDRQLSMFLKRRHEWLSALKPTFTLINKTSGEKAKLSGAESILD